MKKGFIGGGKIICDVYFVIYVVGSERKERNKEYALFTVFEGKEKVLLRIRL